MKYVIVGCGRVGSMLAKLLVAESHEVSVVDETPGAFKRLGSRFQGHVEVGTGIDYDVLVRAGAKDADGFVAVTNGDNRNVMAALIAQRMFGIKKIVTRIYDPPRGDMYRELGIDTVCPTTIGAKIVRDRLMHMPMDAAPSFDYGKLSSMTVTLGKAHEGRPVGDYERDRRIRIAAIRRGRDVSLPSSVDLLHFGDELNVIVTPDALGEFAQLYGPTVTAIELGV